MMKCQQAAEFFADLIDGTLGAEVRRSVERHLSHCPPCEQLVQGYRKTSSLCRASLRKEAPAELRSRLMAFLRSRCCDDDS